MQIRSDLVEPLVTSMASVIAPFIILARDDFVFPHCFELIFQTRLQCTIGRSDDFFIELLSQRLISRKFYLLVGEMFEVR